MKLTIRLTILLFLLLAVHVASMAVTRVRTPQGVELPATPLTALPLRLGDWVCRGVTERGPDDEILAEAAVDLHRVYHYADRQIPARVYVAMWTDYQMRLPHPPLVCYPANGNQILDTEEIRLNRTDATSARAHLLHVESKSEQGYVLYWYQLEDHFMWNTDHGRDAIWTLQGRDRWPPLVKVILDVRGVDEQTGPRLLQDLGEQILQWISTELLALQPAVS